MLDYNVVAWIARVVLCIHKKNRKIERDQGASKLPPAAKSRACKEKRLVCRRACVNAPIGFSFQMPFPIIFNANYTYLNIKSYFGVLE